MQLDNNFYEDMISVFDACFSGLFGDSIVKEECVCNFDNRGIFSLTYKYLPHNYMLVVENEFRSFDINIVDSMQASNSLYRITKFNNQLNKDCIMEALRLLKELLERNDLNFYFYKDGKLYRRNAQGTKRVRDIKEVLNG